MSADSMLTVAVNIFTAPREAFAAIRQRPRFWFPLVLLLLVTVVPTVIYLMGVDIEWLIEGQVRAAGADLTDAEIEQRVAAAAALPRPVLAGFSAFSILFVTSAIYLLSALYYRIVSVFVKDGIRYVQWLGLVCWCALPSLLTQIATTVNLTTNDITLMPQSEVNPLSIGNLLGIEAAAGSPLAQIGAYLDPTTLWTLILTILGYNAWTRKGWAFSTLIVIAPVLLIVGVVLALGTLRAT